MSEANSGESSEANSVGTSEASDAAASEAPSTEAEMAIDAEILRLTTARGPGRSICPTEVARALEPAAGEAWRRHLDPVRRAAARLATAGRIEILRKGKPIDPAVIKGVIRLRIRGEAAPDADTAATSKSAGKG